MIIIIFLLLIFIGFLLFNPLKVTYNETTGLPQSSVLPFGIYCVSCVLLSFFLLAKGNEFGFWSDTENNALHTETENYAAPQNFNVTPARRTNDINFGADYENAPDEYGFISLKINPMSDFDGKTKEELFQIRKTIVDEYNGLGGKDYQPSQRVFGNIQDGKPWWGTEGILCKGQGEHASDGLSRESSYFNNPFILLNLSLSRVMNGNPGKEDCADLWPMPEKLLINPRNKSIAVRYNLSGFMKEFEGSRFYNSTKKNDWFSFDNINARDFGYNYAVAYKLKNLRFANSTNVSTGAELNNYWCLGHSCQIPGGCNNICPSNDAFGFFVDDYPAAAYFRLYKTQPISNNERPDAYFTVYLY